MYNTKMRRNEVGVFNTINCILAFNVRAKDNMFWKNCLTVGEFKRYLFLLLTTNILSKSNIAPSKFSCTLFWAYSK
jgi:hypothetical protein